MSGIWTILVWVGACVASVLFMAWALRRCLDSVTRYIDQSVRQEHELAEMRRRLK